MKFIRVLHAGALNYGILYHGTDMEFNNFEEIYQNGGYLGKGFYFTLSKSMAESYGRIIIKAKLFCKNSFFINDDIFTEDMLKELNVTEEIANKYNELLNSQNFKYTKDANMYLFDICDFYNYDTTKVLKKNGYDSIDNINNESEFVCLYPNLIEIVDIL